eukprot:scaffold130146_cov19-Prasinocladus_malaysianus.AAC.1
MIQEPAQGVPGGEGLPGRGGGGGREEEAGAARGALGRQDEGHADRKRFCHPRAVIFTSK